MTIRDALYDDIQNKHKCLQKVAKVDFYTVCQSNKGENMWQMLFEEGEMLLNGITIRTC